VVAVGVFDGVHRGHSLILRQVKAEAKKYGCPCAVVTFTYHPSHLFDPLKKIPHITTLKEKLFLLGAAGIDICYVIHFDRAFASKTPQDFVKNILVERIGMVSLFVGEDFVFGRGGRGDVRLLKKISQGTGFKLRVVKHLKVAHKIVSSTLIRRLMSAGDVAAAGLLLGRPITLLGRVIKGEGRGRTLGYPTANIQPRREVLLSSGIYATMCSYDGSLFPCVTYIGTKPTFGDRSKKRSIEVFLFDFKNNIYGKNIKVVFIKRLRSDRKFSSQEALVCAMQRDINLAKKFLAKS
jgi:riboflavin kinase/FMN adenylyltransferase